jgi:hypothetical protein
MINDDIAWGLDLALKCAAAFLLLALTREVRTTGEALNEIASRPTSENANTIIRDVTITATEGRMKYGIMMMNHSDTPLLGLSTPEWAKLKGEVRVPRHGYTVVHSNE